MNKKPLKLRTAHSLKWNLVDKIATQILYAITGIILARVLSPGDFGLVGAALVFQAFASLLIDSGFSYALLQKKRPTRLDYSSVLWFNMTMAVSLYVVLYFCAPFIADWFQGDMRLVPVSRVLFVAIILNAATIVQTNRLTKAMEVRGVAVANSLGLIVGGAVGITLAITGYGVWAIVYQTLSTATMRGFVLWTTSKWRPLMKFSMTSLKSFLHVGTSMMFTSFLNTLFQNIYSFFIGNRVGLIPLGYYTQADKWSKMGTSSISQVLTSSFIPALSAVQDDEDRFRRLCSKMTRFTAYIVFPAMLWLVVMATPIFHALFGTKWDPSIILFQILLIRGIFVVLTSLSSNFILSLGQGGKIVKLEILRDSVALGALVATLPFMPWETSTNPVYGLEILLLGQLLASAIAWVATVICAAKLSNSTILGYLKDIAPFLALTLLTLPVMAFAGKIVENAWLELIVEGTTGVCIYLVINWLLRSKIQDDVFGYLRGKRIAD